MALGKLMLNPFAAASEDAFDTHPLPPLYSGFMALGKLMLNPFAAASEDAFDTHAFLRGTRAACRAVADAAYLDRGQVRIAEGPRGGGRGAEPCFPGYNFNNTAADAAYLDRGQVCGARLDWNGPCLF
jgi:hypothetical protein